MRAPSFAIPIVRYVCMNGLHVAKLASHVVGILAILYAVTHATRAIILLWHMHCIISDHSVIHSFVRNARFSAVISATRPMDAACILLLFLFDIHNVQRCLYLIPHRDRFKQLCMRLASANSVKCMAHEFFLTRGQTHL